MINPNQQQNKQSGFSLIEIMVVVSIIAILATIAYPSMQQQMAERRMQDARLTILQAFQEAKAQNLILQRPIKIVLKNNSNTYSLQMCATQNTARSSGCQSGDTLLQTYKFNAQTKLLDQHNRYLSDNVTLVVKDRGRIVSLRTLGTNSERGENMTYVICDKGHTGNARIRIRYEGNVRPRHDTKDGVCPA